MTNYEILFSRTANEDGSFPMEVTDGESGSCYNLYRTKPENVIRETRMVQTSKGRVFQLGTVLVSEHEGRGVAWPVENVITDETLAEWRLGFPGQQKSAPYLTPLSPSQRYLAVEEAKLRMGENTGWNFSGAVSQAVVDVKKGQTPCLDRWRESMAKQSA